MALVGMEMSDGLLCRPWGWAAQKSDATASLTSACTGRWCWWAKARAAAMNRVAVDAPTDFGDDSAPLDSLVGGDEGGSE